MSWNPAKILTCWSCLLLITITAVAEDEATFASFLPDSVVAYAEVPQPGRLIALVLDHPLRASIEALPPWRAWVQGEDYRQLQSVVSLVERELGSSWRLSLESLTKHGLFLAFDSETNGAVLAGRASDAEIVRRAGETLLDLAAADAARNGRPNPIQRRDYRGFQVIRAGNARIATYENWWLLTNNRQLGKQIVDAYLDGQGRSLASQQWFHAAAQSSDSDSLGWAFVDVGTLREEGVAPELLQGRAKDFGAELLFGGVLAALEKAPYVSLDLKGDFAKTRLTIACPFSCDGIGESRQYYFDTARPRVAFSPLSIPSAIASISIHRDLGHLWNHAVDLFEDENVLAQLDKAESDLSTLIGGRHFGDNLLGALGPNFHLVVADPGETTEGDLKKSLHLPGVAMIGQLKSPAESQRTFQVAFQSVISFANFESSNSGYPPFELDVLREGEAKIVTATYLDEASSSESSPGRFADNVRDNISPTLVFAKDKVIVSSTQALARQLIPCLDRESESLESVNASSLSETINTRLQIQGATLATILDRNKNTLVQRNMLEKGHDKSAAKAEIEMLLELVSLIEQADIRLHVEDDELKLDFALSVFDPSVATPAK